MRNLIDEAKGPHPDFAIIEAIVFDRGHSDKIFGATQRNAVLADIFRILLWSKTILTFYYCTPNKCNKRYALAMIVYPLFRSTRHAPPTLRSALHRSFADWRVSVPIRTW